MSNKEKFNYLSSNTSLQEINKLVDSKDYFEEIFDNKLNKLISSLKKLNKD
ncbi:MAG: hypothetical protein K2J02_03485 [Malacoplasma sp.]|nr:hypothetical protein [Malacoplasma sp.]MDE6894409.1 hypothetical protein [Malacoplasma sp.]MDE7075533.1 hypothetical protein [Malacoplasma sp.]